MIDYRDLPYHLTELRSFKGNRIESIKNFISNIDDKEKKEKSSGILSNYIKFIVFSQLNREGVQETDEFLDINPKKWLIYNLSVIYLISIQDFGKEIDYKDIITTVHTRYDFSDIIIKRIRGFINKTDDLQKKEIAKKVLNTYLKRAIYNKLKQIDLPNYKKFKSKMHPALWLIVQIQILLKKINNIKQEIDTGKSISYNAHNKLLSFYFLENN